MVLADSGIPGLGPMAGRAAGERDVAMPELKQVPERRVPGGLVEEMLAYSCLAFV